jgi:hypothetical protein
MARTTENNSQRSAKSKKPNRKSTLKQVIRVYQYTAKYVKSMPVWMILSLVVPIGAAIGLSAGFHASWLGWIINLVLGITLGLLIATLVLTRVADNVGYQRLEGKPGATGAVVSSITTAGYSFDEAPVWMDRRTKDGIWQGTGRSGLFLIGEGNRARLDQEMNRIEREVRHMTPGSQLPIYRIYVGNGKGRTPLKKLRRTIVSKKVVMTKEELNQLNGRLRSLAARGQQIPRSIDPRRIHISRRMMR